ncbi:MAG: hypothetical protein JKP96_01230 [Oceanicaulis sp.]|jgi:DNA repair protein RadC|nr:hypothetical protein [Oceanicaulis sp.]
MSASVVSINNDVTADEVTLVAGESAQLLAHVLKRYMPISHAAATARRLVLSKGGLSGVLKAALDPNEDLMVPAAAIENLKLIQEASEVLVSEQIHERDLMSSYSLVRDYFVTKLRGRSKEQLRVLHLDKKNRLICDQVFDGTVDFCTVYPREIAQRALNVGAVAVCFAHNHPAGDPRPSAGDIKYTHTLIDTLKPLGITVHDHLVIGLNDVSSMKSLGLI